MEELKLCPFCGGKAEFHQFANPKNFYGVKCTQCSCGTDGYKLCRSENTAQENKAANAHVWNHRAEPENKALTLEQLKQMDGKPVYLEYSNEWHEWALITAHGDTVWITFANGDTQSAAGWMKDGYVFYARKSKGE